MILLLALSAQADELRLPMPTARMYTTRDQVCLNRPTHEPIAPTEVTDGRFTVTCGTEGARLRVCIALELDTWPRRVGEVECGGLQVVPVPAFDPTEDIWDGVSIRRDVSLLSGTWNAGEVDYAPGLLDGGRCGISYGQFWFVGPDRRAQACTLVMPDGTERVVPIRVVDRLPR